MESTIWFTDGFVVITGEIGSGKTTLIETFLRELEKDVVVAQISQTQVSPVEFLQAVLVQFGFSPFKMRKVELLATLNSFLIEQYAAGRKVLLIVDEAQNLSQARARGNAHAVGRRDHQGEGAAHHPGRPAGAQRQARLAGAGAAHAARAPALPPDGAVGRGDAATTSCIASRWRARDGRKIFAEDTFPMIFRYTRRRAAPDQHAVRHGDDGALFAEQTAIGVDASSKAAVEELQWVEFARAHQPHARRCDRRRGAAPRPRRPATRCWRASSSRTPAQRVEERPLRLGRLIIGRTPDNDVQIDSRFVSRHHCQIVTTATAASSRI